jgi:hypothetical protein
MTQIPNDIDQYAEDDDPGYPETTDTDREYCIQIGEHFKSIIPHNGHDVCFNCGGLE